MSRRNALQLEDLRWTICLVQMNTTRSGHSGLLLSLHSDEKEGKLNKDLALQGINRVRKETDFPSLIVSLM